MSGWIGKTLGKVYIEDLIARGGIGEVYMGKHSTWQRAVAVKVLLNQYEDDPELLDRFQREARVVARLHHPNIIQIYDFDTVDGHPYLVMDYIAGMPLSTYLQSLQSINQKMDLSLVSNLITAIANALQYAHGRGVIHRDVKPSNILLTAASSLVEPNKVMPADVKPVLTDFGLVRFIQSPRLTATGQIFGTPYYMSPEQALGEKTADARSDIYSLGVVLYEMLSGRVPFDAESSMGILLKHINEPPPPLPLETIPTSLQAVIDRVLAKEPSERFQTPSELAVALENAITGRHESPTIFPRGLTSSHTAKPIQKRTDRPRLNWIPSALIAGAILMAAGLFILRPRGPSAPTNPASASITKPAASPTSLSSTIPPPYLPFAQAPVADSTTELAVLRFQDSAARVDEVIMTSFNMPLPPGGTHYEIWLIDDTGKRFLNIGILQLDPAGKGTQRFSDPTGHDLLALYSKMEITLESNANSTPNPNPVTQAAYSAGLPPAGLIEIRHLLVSVPDAPNNTASVDGLLKDATLVDNSAHQMLADYESHNQAAARFEAEAILNLLVGIQSQDHGDRNADGQVTDPGDGYGMLMNGNNMGYIQATYLQANAAASAADATASMKVQGERVKICVQNLEQWAPPLRDLMKQMLQTQTGTDTGDFVRQAASLADNILKGTDLNGNKQFETIPGECGTQTVYQYAYYLADIPIFVNNPLSGPTSTSQAGLPNQAPPIISTNPPRPTTRPPQPTHPTHPTQKPKPTKHP